MYISVIGAAKCNQKTANIAFEVGKKIAEKGAILVCGGLGGVMDAAAQGAREAGGLVVGILPGENRAGTSSYLDVALPTGLGEARNALVARAGDAVVAIEGEFGTLSEIGLALKMGRLVIGLSTWQLYKKEKDTLAVIPAKNPEEAIKIIFDRVNCEE